MKQAIALGWLLAAGFLQAEAPMDLDSPFQKAAFIKAKSGATEKREIKKARVIGDNVEMEKIDGGIAIFPVQDVVAILPLFPQGEPVGTAEQAEEAMRLLQGVSPDLARQVGYEGATIEQWQKLRERLKELARQREEEERRKKEAREFEVQASLAKQVQAWLDQAGELRTPRTAKELAALKQAGEELAQKSPASMDDLVEMLAVLTQVQPKEKGEAMPNLAKLREVQAKLAPDDLLGWLAGGGLILSFFWLLSGLGLLSTGWTRAKEGAWLGGALFGLGGAGLLALLAWTWLPASVSGQAVVPRVDPRMDDLGIFLKNRAQPVYFLPKKQFLFSPEEWRAGVLAILPVAEESKGIFRARLKTGSLFLTESGWFWRQPLTALGVPIPLTMTFEGKRPDWKDWENPVIAKVLLGRWPLPAPIAGFFGEAALGVWKQGLTSAGISGVKLEQDSQGFVCISVPAAGIRPKYEIATDAQIARDPVAEVLREVQGRKELSAEELAGIFVRIKDLGPGQLQRFAGEMQNKFFILHGIVEGVGSGNFSSSGKLGPDTPDEIFLLGVKDFYRRGEGNPAGADSRQNLLVRCLIKSDWIFEIDSRKDLYAREVLQKFEQNPKGPIFEPPEVRFRTISGVQVTTPRVDPAKERPLIQRGKRLRFKKPLRMELNLKDLEVFAEGKSLPAVKGDGIRKIPFTDPSGDIEMYGLTLEPGGSITTILEEVDSDYQSKIQK